VVTDAGMPLTANSFLVLHDEIARGAISPVNYCLPNSHCASSSEFPASPCAGADRPRRTGATSNAGKESDPFVREARSVRIAATCSLLYGRPAAERMRREARSRRVGPSRSAAGRHRQGAITGDALYDCGCAANVELVNPLIVTGYREFADHHQTTTPSPTPRCLASCPTPDHGRPHPNSRITAEWPVPAPHSCSDTADRWLLLRPAPKGCTAEPLHDTRLGPNAPAPCSYALHRPLKDLQACIYNCRIERADLLTSSCSPSDARQSLESYRRAPTGRPIAQLSTPPRRVARVHRPRARSALGKLS